MFLFLARFGAVLNGSFGMAYRMNVYISYMSSDVVFYCFVHARITRLCLYISIDVRVCVSFVVSLPSVSVYRYKIYGICNSK